MNTEFFEDVVSEKPIEHTPISNDRDEPKLTQRQKAEKHLHVSVLVYPFHDEVHDGLMDVMFEGNYREQCNLEFDCWFNQKINHNITASFIKAMDVIIICNEGITCFRELLLLT